MIKIETVGKPYMNYLYKCIPLAFDESMSYWEQVSSLAYYLINEVMPTINNNANALEELQEYVYNIDLQDEVDNKLDEMYENGQLEAIISEFIALKTTYAYDSVAELSSATNLVSGCYARTSGFYSYNDGGGALYKIRDKEVSDTVDNVLIIELTDNSIIAELIITEPMNPKQFGAYGDETHDDTDAIQKCFNNCHNIIFDKGIYMIDAYTSIKPLSNSIIDLGDATIKCITNDLSNYQMIFLKNVSNVKISNGNVVGDRDTHTGVSGEWGHCIRVDGSSNIELSNIKISKGWGDGLYVLNSSNVKTYGLYINNTRRNGISVISADGFISTNDYVENIEGTAPQSAIDIEPNTTTDYLKNIILNNFTAYNCSGNGISIPMTNLGNNNEVTITINNPKISSCKDGIAESNVGGLSGRLVINNPQIYNVLRNAINFINPVNDATIQNCIKIYVNNAYIENFNLNNAENVYGIGLGTSNSNWGNVFITKPYIVTTDEVKDNCYGVGLNGYSNGHPINCILDTPLNNQLPIRNSYGENIKIIDPLELYTLNDYESGYLAEDEKDIYTVFTNKDKVADERLSIRNYTSKGLDITFRCMNDTIPFRVRIPADTYCRTLDTTNARITIQLNHYGDSITLRRVSDTEWIVVNLNCTPTITTT